MRINEIFYSIQGEGFYTGVPAVFVRFSGCNIKCSFCDTDHTSYNEMTEEDIVENVSKYLARHIVITGGEPSIQITTSLVDKLHKAGFYVQMETNGSIRLPEKCNIDWITCSPKYAKVIIQHIDELKVVYQKQDMNCYDTLQAKEYRLQPCDTGNEEANAQNLKETLDYILTHPKWHLSLQTHKMINVR